MKSYLNRREISISDLTTGPWHWHIGKCTLFPYNVQNAYIWEALGYPNHCCSIDKVCTPGGCNFISTVDCYSRKSKNIQPSPSFITILHPLVSATSSFRSLLRFNQHLYLLNILVPGEMTVSFVVGFKDPWRWTHRRNLIFWVWMSAHFWWVLEFFLVRGMDGNGGLRLKVCDMAIIQYGWIDDNELG